MDGAGVASEAGVDTDDSVLDVLSVELAPLERFRRANIANRASLLARNRFRRLLLVLALPLPLRELGVLGPFLELGVPGGKATQAEVVLQLVLSSVRVELVTVEFSWKCNPGVISFGKENSLDENDLIDGLILLLFMERELAELGVVGPRLFSRE